MSTAQYCAIVLPRLAYIHAVIQYTPQKLRQLQATPKQAYLISSAISLQLISHQNVLSLLSRSRTVAVSDIFGHCVSAYCLANYAQLA